MYNRYIPQPDGSYRRNRMQDQSQPQQPQSQRQEEPRQPSPPPCSPEPETPPCQKGQPCTHMRPPSRPAPPPPPHRQRTGNQGLGIGNFLRQLLPKDFDTEDLIVVLLLLLMAGDCQEDQNSALLTLALYLFM